MEERKFVSSSVAAVSENPQVEMDFSAEHHSTQQAQIRSCVDRPLHPPLTRGTGQMGPPLTGSLSTPRLPCIVRCTSIVLINRISVFPHFGKVVLLGDGRLRQGESKVKVQRAALVHRRQAWHSGTIWRSCQSASAEVLSQIRPTIGQWKKEVL